MSWFAEHLWILMAAGGVVSCVLGRHYDPMRPKQNPSWKKLAWIATRYAATVFPLFYMLQAFLKGLYGKGWMANLL